MAVVDVPAAATAEEQYRGNWSCCGADAEEDGAD
eukprot:SAG11_NODE_40230_length_207_cov_14.259259_1_plen_33_part_10